MTNKLSIWLALLIAAGLAYDYTSNDGAFAFATAQQFVRLVEFLRFWN